MEDPSLCVSFSLCNSFFQINSFKKLYLKKYDLEQAFGIKFETVPVQLASCVGAHGVAKPLASVPIGEQLKQVGLAHPPGLSSGSLLQPWPRYLRSEPVNERSFSLSAFLINLKF